MFSLIMGSLEILTHARGVFGIVFVKGNGIRLLRSFCLIDKRPIRAHGAKSATVGAHREVINGSGPGRAQVSEPAELHEDFVFNEKARCRNGRNEMPFGEVRRKDRED